MSAKKNKAKLLLYISLVFLFTSCITSVNYVGKSYAPTNQVDVYADWREVPPQYEIMGYGDATPQGFGGVEEAQKKLEKKACEKGADAIVLEGVEMTPVNPTITTTTDSKRNSDGGKTTTSTTTQDVQALQTLKVTFIKYKKN